ncbi:ATPase [Rhodobacteraceae bacterium NNCM2]|nr:ATPase [Coraliihabitans acroporae]
MKVFWKEVAVTPADQGFGIALDGRPIKTPAKAALSLPNAPLAEAVAEEWRGQGEELDPATMPLTRAVNTVIDRVGPNLSAVHEEVAKYGQTDLLCYRAPHPEALRRRQAAAWDPLLAWSEEELGAALMTTEGVMHCLQPQESLDTLSATVARHDPWELAALHDLVALSGSLVIGLAVSHGRLGAPEAWPMSRIDEMWNIEEWGADDEAERLAALKERDFLNAARLLELVRGG